MRTIGVVTVSRSDYGIYQPVLRRIRKDPDLRLHIFASGMHLSPDFGLTVQVIRQDGFKIEDCIEMLLSSDTPEGLGKSVGLGIIGFAQAYARFRPDILLVLGDRYEMFAAVVAALPFKIPIAHIHGGESTEGLIDEAIRHSITKMSHMHFASTGHYAKRIVQMGEDPSRVIISGAPSLDNIKGLRLLSPQELQAQYGLDLSQPTLLVTYHPVTLEYESTEAQIDELLLALEEVQLPIIFTFPNADTQDRIIIKRIKEFTTRYGSAKTVTSLGTQAYFSVMRSVAAMVGNSSSGIIEAASFKLPVVNIGIRQQGRMHGKNVIDVDCTRAEIVVGIERATSNKFRNALSDMINPYGDGHAAEVIVERLRTVSISRDLLIKRFFEIPG
jgi:UDP-hydrolysing UDP-N-acetyl-D-glucosamine 2-epimerase